ncbi:MAG: asparagine synthase (glutamine-hydrolyzing) [Oscillospiraceae bacterium]|nr:asparagine synthase (glutamine-hydrolyzing) [Oscillospiraceae bacterium]
MFSGTHTAGQLKLRAETMRRGCVVLAFDGALYNMDMEGLFEGLARRGAGFLRELDGCFALAFWDGRQREGTLLLARDRIGAKPLFYARENDRLYFGSEPGSLFDAGFEPALDKDSLRELFALGPARSPGHGVFRGLRELLPGQWMTVGREGPREGFYWKLESRAHSDTYEETIEKTTALLQSAVERQMVSEKPLCAFLSGGLDSSLVSAIAARRLAERGELLASFSFDFAGNSGHYKASAFQPSQDAPFAAEMAEHLRTKHTVLECGPRTLADLLEPAVIARGFPGMGDIDSSLLYFCSMVGREYGVALTGECGDEIFGGYPWFRGEAAFRERCFPWSRDMEARKTFLRDDVLAELRLEDYARAAYEASVAETPRLESDTPEEARRREIAWLNLRWFMQTLLCRMERCGAATGVDGRVPFADTRLLEYAWSIPWEMKCKDGVVKNILREAGRGLLPESVRARQKSPFPKIYDPAYERLLAERMRDLLASPNEPVHSYVDKAKAEAFLRAPADYGKPWYGQLMAAPQRVAWFLQLNYWLKAYTKRPLSV